MKKRYRSGPIVRGFVLMQVIKKGSIEAPERGGVMLEPWLRGNLTEIDSVRRGVLHALEQAAEDVMRWCGDLSDAEMEARLFGLASVGFHLRHIARSLDRLLTYAEGERLDSTQLEKLRTEMDGDWHEATLVEFMDGLEVAMVRVRRLQPETFEETRGVGRMCQPSSVGGVLVHCAEHTQRHVGQAITTAKMVIGMRC
jgi:hypothetical protein